MPADSPIFIIGCGRSGTTLLRMMLDSHPRISAGEETKFLTDLQPIVGEHWSLLSAYGFSREWWLDRIRAFYGDFQAEYLAKRGKQRWAEKTPGYTFHLDFIAELFPDAQYVHVIRDGRDVALSWEKLSQIRRLPGDPRELRLAKFEVRADDQPEGRHCRC